VFGVNQELGGKLFALSLSAEQKAKSSKRQNVSQLSAAETLGKLDALDASAPAHELYGFEGSVKSDGSSGCTEVKSSADKSVSE
jgi:hypothetical protein